MAQNRVYKFQDIFEVQSHLNGAIFGGNISKGIAGLVGQVLSFTRPTFDVTFAIGTGPDANTLLFADIKQQIEAKSSLISVGQVGGRIFFIEATPSEGVALSANNEPAKSLLGFDQTGAVVGRCYKPLGLAGAVPPFYSWAYSVNETTHVVFTWE